MIRFIHGFDLFREPKIARSMFRHRAEQFGKRLNWDVHVDKDGFERDYYDQLNPLYVIVTRDDGEHLGSMRLLPTMGPTMLNDHFCGLNDGQTIQSPSTWECTRFCLAPSASPRTALKLLAAGASLMKELNLVHLVAVFDHKMGRVYRRSQASPNIIASGQYSGTLVSIGRWRYSREHHAALLLAAGIGATEMELYLVNSDITHEVKRYA